MRFLLTGATGFLGSYLAADLVAAGQEVTVLLRPNADTWRLAEILPRLTVLRGDLGDIEDVRAQIGSARFDGVAHLAWRGVGNADRNSPLQACNIADTVMLADLAASVGAATFVGAGSQAEYGPYDRAIRADDVCRPTTLYGKAKLAACEMTRQLCADRGLRFAWLRIFSTYGPGDAPYWLIPSMIRCLRAGERMPLTRCEQHWGFLHARDAATAFRTVLCDSRAEGIFNLGSSDAPPLRETVLRLRDLVNPAAEPGFGDVPYRSDQVMTLQADISGLTALGWRPKIDLTSGLRETVAWHDAAERT
jgi:UDP-glucose 4-epimerase